MTHAEDKCLSVAASSIISRYIFLSQMKKLSNQEEIKLPKGAGAQVDEVAKKIADKKGVEYLDNIAKTNFKNMEKITQNKEWSL